MDKKPSKLKEITSKIDGGLLVIFALPWLIISLNRAWLFSLSAIDPWIYFGYFVRLEQNLKAFAGTYYGSRLSWIVPGHLIYQWFPPLVANYVLHVGFYYLAVISLYLILKSTVSARAALFTAILMGSYTHFLNDIGWDYVDGAGITYFLLTILMLHRAAISRQSTRQSKIWLVMAGVFYGSLIYSNVVWLILTPSIVLYYGLTNQKHRKNSLLISLLFFILGLLFITLLLGTINYRITGIFLFFLGSFNYAVSNVSQPNPWLKDWLVWLPRSTWLLLPTVTFLTSSLILLLKQRRIVEPASNGAALSYFQLIHILNFLTFVFCQVKGGAFLQYLYYASYLIPSTFLAIGSQLTVLDRLKRRHFLCLTAGVTTLLALSNLRSLGTSFDRVWVINSSLTCLLSLIGLWLLPSLNQVLQKAFVIGIAALVLAPSLYGLTLGSKTDGFKSLQSTSPTPEYVEEDFFLGVVQAVKVLNAIDPDSSLIFWYNKQESVIYKPIAAIYLWGYRLIGHQFPKLSYWAVPPDSPQNLEQIQALLKQHSQVVILSKQPDALQQAQRSLEQIGYSARVLSKHDIQQGSFIFTMTVIEVYRKGDR